jgi:hypothetical protein
VAGRNTRILLLMTKVDDIKAHQRHHTLISEFAKSNFSGVIKVTDFKMIRVGLT